MTAQELAELFRDAYDHAPHRDKTLHVTLFGLKYADALEQHVSQDVCALAGVGNWGPQLILAKKLSQHVVLK